MRKGLLVLSLLLVNCGLLVSQNPPADKAKRPSPPATAQCKFPDGKTITVDYSTPSMKGRKIYGGLVPFTEVWRTGANEATTFVTNTDVVIGGTTVPAGSYTLYTLPGEKAWKLIISKKTGQWGVPYPGAQSDFGRFEMQTQLIEIPIEKLQISFMEKPGAKDTCTLRIDWDKTRAFIDIAEKH